ncbi:MAG: alkaline phosphatase D family protein [Bdellovibrionaceae bacterium]|nr:alkaline phosphatase D family protein [Pseudobdellovibrionaceae bacterium]
MIHRREFLQRSALIATAALLPAPWAAASEQSAQAVDLSRWPIMQGPTDDESASFVLLIPHGVEFALQAQDSRGGLLPLETLESWLVPGTNTRTLEVAVTGLAVGEDYTLSLTDANGDVFDERRFRALDIHRPEARFAVMSCMYDRFHSPGMWEALARENCDFVVFLGDTCYADQSNPQRDEAGYGARYAQTRQRLAWFRQPRLVPSYAVWDDHDFGGNNKNRHFPMKEFMRGMFRRFWGSRPNRAWGPAFGAGSVLQAFGQRFYLMDDRTYRDRPYLSSGRHWGENQTDWLLDDLSRSDRPAWLMNGSQYFGGYLRKESFEYCQKEDFAALLPRLARVQAPVAFVSGDVHFSELMRIEPALLGYPTYEFTSSSIHSMTFPFHQHRHGRNPRRVASEWRYNFLVFDVNAEKGWDIDTRCVLSSNRTSFQKRLTISRS